MEREEVSKAIDELFTRVRKVEIRQAVIEQKEETIIEKIQDLKDTFIEHDKKEMSKYENINSNLKTLQKIVWLGIGAGAILQLIGIERLKIIFGG